VRCLPAGGHAFVSTLAKGHTMATALQPGRLSRRISTSFPTWPSSAKPISSWASAKTHEPNPSKQDR
jgi:hypothetical protein